MGSVQAEKVMMKGMPEGDLRAVRYFLQQTILSVQELMRELPASRSLEKTLAMLWATSDSLDDLYDE